MLFMEPVDRSTAKQVPMRVLAHLGDAVFDLFEREREVLNTGSARQMHGRVVSRVAAGKQSEILDQLSARLTDDELNIVRMARNLKASGYRRAGQALSRKSTAFEALIGYLYLTDQERLKQVLHWSIQH